MNGIFWLVIAVVFGVIEAMTATLVTIWFAASALITALLAIFVNNTFVLFTVFVVLSAVLVAATRPVTKRFLNKKAVATNADRIILAKGTVLKRLDPIQNTGQVSVMGQVWSAKSADGEAIEVGTTVIVKALEGVRVVVEKAE